MAGTGPDNDRFHTLTEAFTGDLAGSPSQILSTNGKVPQVIIEISLGGEVTTCTPEGASLLGSAYEQDMMDCNASGDAQPACEYVLDVHTPEFRIIAKGEDGSYENRLATPEEKATCCREIYFESETDFTDERWAEIYLVWAAASDLESEEERGHG